MNSVVLIGRITKDAAIKYTQNKVSVASFTIAFLSAFFLGYKIIFARYSFILFTFAVCDSFEVSFLLRSTAIPIDLAYLRERIPAFLISSFVNPLPSRILLLYLLVCPLTMGLRVWVGLGATFAALAALAS